MISRVAALKVLGRSIFAYISKERCQIRSVLTVKRVRYTQRLDRLSGEGKRRHTGVVEQVGIGVQPTYIVRLDISHHKRENGLTLLRILHRKRQNRLGHFVKKAYH